MQVATTTRPDTVAKVEALTDRLFSYVRKDGGKKRFFVGISIETIFVSKQGRECVTMKVRDMESQEKAFKTLWVDNITPFVS